MATRIFNMMQQRWGAAAIFGDFFVVKWEEWGVRGELRAASLVLLNGKIGLCFTRCALEFLLMEHRSMNGPTDGRRVWKSEKNAVILEPVL